MGQTGGFLYHLFDDLICLNCGSPEMMKAGYSACVIVMDMEYRCNAYEAGCKEAEKDEQ